jgi:hypothetical protein
MWSIVASVRVGIDFHIFLGTHSDGYLDPCIIIEFKDRTK